VKALAGAGLGIATFTVLAGRPPRPQPSARTDGRVLFAASVSAACEELLWRGPLLRSLHHRLGAGGAVALDAAGFAASHGRRARLAHVLLGAVFATAALTPAGLAAAVSAHVVYDLLVLLEEPS
jgi:membrane protease YdiL (CAAX protease family)